MCTRVLWNENPLGVLVARTMDWPESTEPTLLVFPRGLARDGSLLGGVSAFRDNPARWTSRYGSLITSVYGLGAFDGLNERGFGLHSLYLRSTEFGLREPALPGVQAGLWGQYLLDNAATVSEALELAAAVQPVMVEARGRKATVHLAIEDEHGDSAIVEYLAGKRTVHHGREFRIMTNDPPYDEQLALLRGRDFSTPSSDLPLPGNVNPRDRFQRATYYAALLPNAKSERAAVAGLFAIANNVSVPFGAPYRDFGIYNTEYRSVCNLTSRRYYFELATSPSVIWVDLLDFDLSPGAPSWTLNPDAVELCGNVTGRFQELPRAPF